MINENRNDGFWFGIFQSHGNDRQKKSHVPQGLHPMMWWNTTAKNGRQEVLVVPGYGMAMARAQQPGSLWGNH